MNSAGSATKENEKYLQSIEAKVKSLQSAWEEFSTKTLSGDVVKGFLSFATALIKITDTAGGLVPVLGLVTGLIILFKKELIATTVITKAKVALDLLINSYIAFSVNMQLAGGGLKGFTSAMLASTTAAGAMTAVFGGLIIALSLITMGVNAYNQAQEKKAALNKETLTNTHEQIIALEDLKTKYNEIMKSEDSAVDKKKKLKDLQNDLNAAYKDNGLDVYGGELDDVNKKIDEQITKNKSLLESQASASSQTVKKKIMTSANPNLAETTKGTGIVGAANIALGNWTEPRLLKTLGVEYASVKEQVLALKDTMENYNSLPTAERTKDMTKANETANSMYTRITGSIKESKDELDSYYKILKDGGKLEKDELDLLDLYNSSVEAGTYIIDDKQRALAETTQKEKEAEAAMKGTSVATVEATTLFTAYQSSIETLDTAMQDLAQVQYEMNETGSISNETLSNMIDKHPEWLQYLTLENGALTMQSGALQILNQLEAQNAASKVGEAMSTRAGIATGLANDYAKASTEAAKLAASEALLVALKDKGMSADEATAEALKITSVMDKIKTTTYTAPTYVDNVKKPSKSKSSAAAAKEVYKPQIEWLQRYESAVENAKDEVDALKDEVGKTDNFQKQEEMTHALIRATNDQIYQTQQLKNAQVGQTEDAIKQLRAYGFAIDYNSQKSELYINNIGRLGAFTGDTAKAIEKLIDQTQSLNKDNMGLDSSIRDLTGDVSDYYKQLAEFPEKRLEKFNELMSEFKESQMSSVEDQLKDLEHAMANDERLNTLNKQIDALKEQTDEVDKQAELNEKLLSIEKAKLALENAREQKNVQIYRKGQGFVWESDKSTIDSAQEDLKSQQKDLQDYLSDEQISNLETQRDEIEKSYQDRIDILQDFLDEQNYLVEKSGRTAIETFGSLRDKLAEFGLDNANYLSQATEWLDKYNTALGNLNTTGIGGNPVAQSLYTSGMSTGMNSVTSGLTYESLLTQISQSGVGMSNNSTGNTTNITIENIELPSVTDADSFLKALDSLPDLASARATTRK